MVAGEPGSRSNLPLFKFFSVNQIINRDIEVIRHFVQHIQTWFAFSVFIV